MNGQSRQKVKEFDEILDDLEFYINSRKVFKKSLQEVCKHE